MKHYKTFSEYIKGESIIRYIPFFERCWKHAQRASRTEELVVLKELLDIAVKYNTSQGCFFRLSIAINKRIKEINDGTITERNHING